MMDKLVTWVLFRFYGAKGFGCDKCDEEFVIVGEPVPTACPYCREPA
jgi:hypothetical protein